MKQIPLGGKHGAGLFALVDDGLDYNTASKMKWYLNSKGYPQHTWCDDGIKYHIRLHTLIAGKPPKGFETDHIDGNRLNAQSSNLRFVKPSENQQRQLKAKTYGGKPCSSRFKGVCWDKQEKKWRATIYKDYKKIHLGYFNFEVDAALTYDTAALQHFGKFARTNFQPVLSKITIPCLSTTCITKDSGTLAAISLAFSTDA